MLEQFHRTFKFSFVRGNLTDFIASDHYPTTTYTLVSKRLILVDTSSTWLLDNSTINDLQARSTPE